MAHFRAMRRIGRLAAALLALALTSAPHAARAQISPDATVAQVNDTPITAQEFYDRLQQLTGRDFVVSLNPLRFIPEDSGQIVMNSLIVEKLTLQLASKSNLLPSEADVNEALGRAKLQQPYAELIARHMLTENTLRNTIRVQRARLNLATEGVKISPEEVEAFYKKHIGEYTIPERWTLSGILTRNSESLPQIAAALKAGTPFGDVAKKYSEDPNTKDNGGKIGILTPESPNLPDALKQAIRKIKPGQVTDVVKIEMTLNPGQPPVPVWYYVKLEADDPAKARPFEDVREDAQARALLEKAGGLQVADKKLVAFRGASVIKVTAPGYESLGTPPKAKTAG
jgi:foldase protein PrsA